MRRLAGPMHSTCIKRARWLIESSLLLLALAPAALAQERAPQTPASAASQSTNSSQYSSSPQKTAGSTTANNSKTSENPAPAPPSVISLHNGLAIELSAEWHRIIPEGSAPPAPLGPYAPAVHFSNELVMANDAQQTILKIATSDNPLLGHDSYWLDAQVHAAPGTSAMSMTNLLFYLFLPPSRACLDHTLAVYNDASRSTQAGDPASQSNIQVSYSCSFAKTLSDFYASQLSSAVTYEQTTNGPRAHPVVADFQLAPMEQVDVNGITFFVFEAQANTEITGDDAAKFNLPRELQGGHADFFWAIGAESPYPFMPDDSRKAVPILQLAYAGSAPGPNPNKRPDFMELLRHIRVDKSGGQ